MTKQKIACELYRLKRAGQEQTLVLGELYSADELLTMLYGREVQPDEAQEFITA